MQARQQTETASNVIQFTSPWMHGAADIPGNMPETSLTDLGNAKRLVMGCSEDIRFCHTTRKWFVWDGTKWAKDDSGQIFRLAKQTVRAILTEAAMATDDKERNAIVAHEQRSESEPRINAIVKLAQSVAGIPIQLGELDRDPMLFNCVNGTLDLRSGEFR